MKEESEHGPRRSFPTVFQDMTQETHNNNTVQTAAHNENPHVSRGYAGLHAQCR